ncbi:MAG: hypothetical protein ACR2NR_21940, partial [Solirubrobacteraceae bacterium]
MSTSAPARDEFLARFAGHASGLLREFNQAGVLAAADVHVARRLGALASEDDEAVLLAVALAVRAPRLGHVLVDLASIRDTAAVDAEEPVDLSALAWPEALDWVARVTASPLVGAEDPTGAESLRDAAARPLRRYESHLYLDRYWAEGGAVAWSFGAISAQPAPGVDEARLQDGLERLFGDESNDRQAQAAAAAVHRRLA